MIVRQSTVGEIEAMPGFSDLLEEYADGSAIAGLPRPAPNMDTYRAMEGMGLLRIFGVFDEGRVVGFLSVLNGPLPHYGISVAMSESFFVSKEARSSLAGLQLLIWGETTAREVESPVFMVSAPVGSKLEALLPKCGYVQTNSVFVKRMLDA